MWVWYAFTKDNKDLLGGHISRIASHVWHRVRFKSHFYKILQPLLHQVTKR